jgi:hypothetical protein
MFIPPFFLQRGRGSAAGLKVRLAATCDAGCCRNHTMCDFAEPRVSFPAETLKLICQYAVLTLTFFLFCDTITRNKKTARELAFNLGVRSVRIPCIRVIFL